MALELAETYPRKAFISGTPVGFEYRRVIKGLGFGEARKEMSDDNCRLCKDPGKAVRVPNIYGANNRLEKYGKAKAAREAKKAEKQAARRKT